MAQPTPDPDLDRPFPWEQDEDLEQPGVTIRPLSHADLAAQLAPRLAVAAGLLAAVTIGWGLRFRPSPEAVAWRRGAVGERRTARLLAALERQGWAVLHDLAVPRSQANIDHLVIGPGGVFVIDSKQYRGRLQFDQSGRLWHGRYPLAPAIQAVSFEADQAALVLAEPDVVVVPILA